MQKYPARAHDVAAYILKKAGPMSTMKLQKLVHYSQAWSLVWDERPLFPESVQAWAQGPVVRALYDEHKGAFTASAPWPKGDPEALDKDARETVDAVLEFYGSMHGAALSDLTHSEAPWKDARRGLAEGARSERVITLKNMAQYYGDLYRRGSAKGKKR